MTIYLVVPKGTIVFAGYTKEPTARVHARTMTGGEVLAVEIEELLTSTVHEDVDEYDDDEPTPVVEILTNKEPKK